MVKVSDLSPEQLAIRRAYNRAAQKRYMARLTPEKRAAKAIVRAKWVAANQEKLKERNRLYAKTYPDRIRTSQDRYAEAHPDRVKASKDKYAKAHPDRIKASEEKYRAKKRLTRSAPVNGVSFRTRLAQNRLYAAADRCVSATLPTDVREDAIQAIVVAVLEGEFSQDDIRVHAKRYVDAAWGLMYRQAYSLDQAIPGYEKLRWIDMLTEDTPHV